jgi:hypothetical protein
LEIVTWVWNLGGAKAWVALDRVSNPTASADRYFGPTDYGARSNLEGDIAAYVVASSAGLPSEPTATTLPPSNSIADALADYFLSRRRNRCLQFLVMQGTRFSGGALRNLTAVHDRMAAKLAAFAR